MAAGPVNGSCTRLDSVAGDYGCRTDARFIEKHAPISLMSLPSRAPENEFFHNDFQSSAGLGRGCNPARGCSRRDLNPCQKLERLLSLATRLRERGDALTMEPA